MFNDVSAVKFYWVNLKASLNPRLVISYIDYSLFKTYRSYMKNHIRRYKYPDTYTPISNDIYYDYDKLIAEDSLAYYKNMSSKFYKRPITNYKKAEVSNEEIKLLKAIETILKKHKTSYKIVVSPLYDQIPLEKEQLELLKSVFKTNSVYNFSGDNELTRPISNFYEQSHYRPVVANKILDSIY